MDACATLTFYKRRPCWVFLFYFPHRTLSEFDCEFKKNVRLYDDEGWVKPIHDFVQAGLNVPERLVWEVPEQLENTIFKAVEFNVQVCLCERIHVSLFKNPISVQVDALVSNLCSRPRETVSRGSHARVVFGVLFVLSSLSSSWGTPQANPPTPHTHTLKPRPPSPGLTPDPGCLPPTPDPITRTRPDHMTAGTHGLFAESENVCWELFCFNKLYFFFFQNNDDLDLVIYDHNMYGKGFIKTCKVTKARTVHISANLSLNFQKTN